MVDMIMSRLQTFADFILGWFCLDGESIVSYSFVGSKPYNLGQVQRQYVVARFNKESEF